MRVIVRAGLALVALVMIAPAALAEEPTRLTLSEAVRHGLEHAPELAMATKAIEAARSRLRSSNRRRLPTVRLEGNAIYWDKELAFDITPPGMELPPGAEAEPIIVRERLTTTASATAALPLSAQILIGNLVAVGRHGVAASEEDRRARRLDVASSAAGAYLGVLLARSTSDINTARTRLVQAQLDRARVLQQGGVLGKVDVMRLEAALAAAQRQAILAVAEASTAEDTLALVLGMPAGTGIEVVDDLPASPPAPPLDPDAAVRAAASHRPDLRAASARASQARSGSRVEAARLLPSLTAIATAQHNTGNGSFQPKNAWFVGLQFSWDIWDWGSNWNTYKAASYDADQAKMGADRMSDRVRAEVRRQAREARAAYDALPVARAGLEASEEAFRIQEARFGEGATTTTELLAAETEVAQARVSYSTARYVYFLQLASLARAVGELPEALLPAGQPRTNGTP